jgi:hypothetical protein
LDAATQQLSSSKEKAKELLQCNADLQQQVDRLQTELEAAVQEREVRESYPKEGCTASCCNGRCNEIADCS